MNTADLIKTWIKDDPFRMQTLRCAAELQLNDWCLAAGFVRNLVWDHVHEFAAPTPLNDIDLIYFNNWDSAEQTDRAYEQHLHSVCDHNWSVKNQARMHARNDDKPYQSTEDAMSYWVEVETAVGVTMFGNGELSLIAPFGLDALFSNTITLNTKRPKLSDFAERIQDKNWLQCWPNLRISI